MSRASCTATSSSRAFLLTKEGRVKLIDSGLFHVYPRLADDTIDRSKPLKEVCGSKSYALAGDPRRRRSPPPKATTDLRPTSGLWASASLGCSPAPSSSRGVVGQRLADWRFQKLIEDQKVFSTTCMPSTRGTTREASHLSSEVVDLLDGMLKIDPEQAYYHGRDPRAPVD